MRTFPRVQYGAVLETNVPAVGFAAGRRTTARVVSLLAEPLSEVLDWIQAVDLVRPADGGGPLDVAIPGAALGLEGRWVATCAQVRLVPRSRLQPGALAVVPEPYLAQIRASVRVLLDV